MSDMVHARVNERLVALRLGNVAVRLDALLSEAARADLTYLDFLDRLLLAESEAKQPSMITLKAAMNDHPKTGQRGAQTGGC